MAKQSQVLILNMVVAATAMVAINLGPNWLLLRAILALALVFMLPGHAIVTAVFPSRSLQVGDGILLSVGVSLGCVVLTGLVLNWTPWGLQASSWAMGLGSLTLIFGLIGLVRGLRVYDGPFIFGWSILGARLRDWMVLSVALLLATGSIVFAQIGEQHQPAAGFAQLWILPVEGDTESVRFGVISQEQGIVAYRLDLKVGSQLLFHWESLTLDRDQEWETTLRIPKSFGVQEPVEVILYRLDSANALPTSVVWWP